MKLFSLILLFSLSSAANTDLSGTALVVDGDTITIGGNKIRLNGIDTPEKNQTCRKAGVTWRCGYEATETLRKWTYTKEVRCIGDTKDRYGRLIANCFVDGYNVNARLVYEGLALAYRKYSKQYVPEEDKARAAKRGMWAGEFVAPWDWRKGKRLDQEEAPIACCKVCKKGKACGDSCIKKTYNCSKPKGCACDG
jgi:endonuclease YncB( thermonuclease family)